MLLQKSKITVISGASAAAQTAVTSAIIDMAQGGYDGVLFIAILDSATTGSVLGLSASDSAVNNTGGMVAISGAQTAAYTATGGEGASALVLDLYKPQQRYLEAILTRTAQNAVLDCIIAIQYCGRKPPAIQDVSVLASLAIAPTA